MANPKAKWATNYYIHVEGKPVEISLLKRQVSQALNALWDVDKVDAFAEVFRRGVEAVIYDPANKKSLDPQEMVVIKELTRIIKTEERDVGLRKILESKGLDEFLNWAVDKGVDCERFLAEVTLPKGKSFSRQILEFLRKELTGKGTVKAVMLRRQLVNAGMLQDTDRDKKRLADLATYYKLSGRGERGYWMWSEEAEALFE
jgi:hypothetical protein